jgi:hypothetical protein
MLVMVVVLWLLLEHLIRPLGLVILWRQVAVLVPMLMVHLGETVMTVVTVRLTLMKM